VGSPARRCHGARRTSRTVAPIPSRAPGPRQPPPPSVHVHPGSARHHLPSRGSRPGTRSGCSRWRPIRLGAGGTPQNRHAFGIELHAGAARVSDDQRHGGNDLDRAERDQRHVPGPEEQDPDEDRPPTQGGERRHPARADEHTVHVGTVVCTRPSPLRRHRSSAHSRSVAAGPCRRNSATVTGDDPRSSSQRAPISSWSW
jgi:hypothetical protein